MNRLPLYLNSIQFFHSIFALPFAFIAALLARRHSNMRLEEWVYIVVAMVGARTWAMGINRLADRRYDRMNPRTAQRPLASGVISSKSMVLITLLGALALFFSAAHLYPNTLYLAPFLLLVLGGYSFSKRFTWLCHFWLGTSLGLTPLAAWYALEGLPPKSLYLLSFAVTFWVSGFDILYATQDETFDRKNSLHSIPARFGSQTSKQIAALLHSAAILFFFLFGLAFQLNLIYFLGCFAAASLLLFQHMWVRQKGFVFINPLFFSINGWVAILLFVFTSFSLLLEN